MRCSRKQGFYLGRVSSDQVNQLSDHGAIGNSKHRSKDPQRLSHYPIFFISDWGLDFYAFMNIISETLPAQNNVPVPHR